MDSEELDSRRRQERLRRRRQWERDARARETAEQREAARLARRRERYRAQRRQESQHTCRAQMDANRAAQHLRREAETPEARQERLQHHRAAERLRREVLSSVLRVFTPSARGIQLSTHVLLSSSQVYIRTSSCMHSGGAHGPPTLCYRKQSTNNVSCSLLRLAPQCPHSLVLTNWRRRDQSWHGDNLFCTHSLYHAALSAYSSSNSFVMRVHNII